MFSYILIHERVNYSDSPEIVRIQLQSKYVSSPLLFAYTVQFNTDLMHSSQNREWSPNRGKLHRKELIDALVFLSGEFHNGLKPLRLLSHTFFLALLYTCEKQHLKFTAFFTIVFGGIFQFVTRVLVFWSYR